MSSNSYSQIARRITLLGGAQAFSMLGALVRNKVAAICIGVAGVGLNTLYWSIATFLANVSGLGLSFSGVASLSEAIASGGGAARMAAGRLRRAEVCLGCASIVLTCLLAPLLSRQYFGDLRHTLAFAAIGLVVMSLVVGGVELAVVKAAQRTRWLAEASVAGTLITAVGTTLFYVWLGQRGVVPALVVCTVLGATVNVWYGHRAVAWYIESEAWRDWTAAMRPMMTLGAVSLATTVVASGVELLVQSCIAMSASLVVVGLYRAGYQLSVGYVGTLFAAVGSDYFPRLTAADCTATRFSLVRRQSAVQLAVAMTAVAAFELLVPWLLPLLFSSEFDAAIPMTRWAMLGTLPYALETPLGFLPVALHRTRHYLMLELAGLLLLTAGCLVGWQTGGLVGIGVGLAVARVLNFVLVYLFCHLAYGFRYLPHSR